VEIKLTSGETLIFQKKIKGNNARICEKNSIYNNQMATNKLRSVFKQYVFIGEVTNIHYSELRAFIKCFFSFSFTCTHTEIQLGLEPNH